MERYQWMITGVYGIYWFSNAQKRKDAIKYHCDTLGISWDYAKRKGDKAIKVCVTKAKRKKK